LINLRQYCSFVPAEAISPFLDLLPDNPRRIKMVVRAMIMLKEETARHGEDEIDWVLLLLASLLRTESDQFLEAFLKYFFNIDSGTTSRWSQSYFGGSQEKRLDNFKNDIKNIFRALDVEDKRVCDRLEALCVAFHSRYWIAGARFQYHCEMLYRPHVDAYPSASGRAAEAMDSALRRAQLASQRHKLRGERPARGPAGTRGISRRTCSHGRSLSH
jgi:hypothetical protein